MNWLAQLAPPIASALGGPLAGLAVEAVAKAVGVAPEEAQGLLDSGKLTSEQLAQVKLAEIELQKQEKALDLNFEQLAVNDRKSARDMQIAAPSYWPGVLSAITTLAVLGTIAARMYGKDLPSDPITIQLIGSLTTGWGMALSYWFGTTRSSGNKDALLAQSAPVK